MSFLKSFTFIKISIPSQLTQVGSLFQPSCSSSSALYGFNPLLAYAGRVIALYCLLKRNTKSVSIPSQLTQVGSQDTFLIIDEAHWSFNPLLAYAGRVIPLSRRILHVLQSSKRFNPLLAYAGRVIPIRDDSPRGVGDRFNPLLAYAGRVIVYLVGNYHILSNIQST